MRFVDKLTAAAERLAHRQLAVPIIVETKVDRFQDVLSAIRGYLGGGRFGFRLLEQITEIFPLLRTIPTFNYIATVLPREWVFDLADAREVQRIYPNSLKYIVAYPTVPPEGIFQYERGAFRETKPFTTTYYTKKLIGADVANKKGYDGTGVRVVVADTGLDRRHPATRHMWLDSTMAQVRDEVGHGEWCAACIGGHYAEDTRLGRKIGRKIPTEGMAPNSIVVGIKCLGYGIGTGTDDAIIKAVELGFSKYRADIISMSLGGPIRGERQEDDPYYKVVKELTERGVIFSVAAGNEGPEPKTIGTPGWLEDVLTVGALDPITGQIASYSSRGPTPDGRIKPDCVSYGGGLEHPIHAPITGWLDKAGDDTATNNFSPIQGTSMATPHVSGLLACMRQAFALRLGKVLTTEEVKRMLEELGEPKNNDTGYGLLDWSMFETWMSSEYGVTL